MSRKPVAQTQTQTILDRLNDCMQSGAAPDEILIAQAKKVARAILTEQAAEAYVLLGVIAVASRASSTEVRDYFEKALRLEPHSVNVLMNYAVSLRVLGEIERSFAMATAALDASKTELELAVSRPIHKTISLLALQLREYEIVHQKERRISDFLDARSILDEDLRKTGVGISQILKSNNVRYRSPGINFYENEQFLALDIGIHADANTVMEMRMSLIEFLMDSDFSFSPTEFAVTFSISCQ